MELILLFRFLNWLVRISPEMREPPHLSRWDLLMIQIKQKREEEERLAREQQEREASGQRRLPPA